jgi:hypothetical protein
MDDAYAVSAEQISAYRRDGHVLLRNVAGPGDLAPYRAAIGAVMAAHRDAAGDLQNRDTYHQAFLQIANLWETDAVVRRFTMARRFAGIAADLMGVDAVRLWHDQALFKEPGGGPTPWHQDQYYWPLDTDRTITMWMPLVDVPVEMGALAFASGSHTEGGFAATAISDASEALFDKLVADRGYPIVTDAMAAGDATFHAGWTLHRAPANGTDRMREVMTVIYFADGTRIGEPANPHQPADLARWLPGGKPGDLAATDLNPVLVRRP